MFASDYRRPDSNLPLMQMTALVKAAETQIDIKLVK